MAKCDCECGHKGVDLATRECDCQPPGDAPSLFWIAANDPVEPLSDPLTAAEGWRMELAVNAALTVVVAAMTGALMGLTFGLVRAVLGNAVIAAHVTIITGLLTLFMVLIDTFLEFGKRK